METPNLNEAMNKIAKEMEIKTLFLIASDNETEACCVGGNTLNIANSLAQLFDKNPAIIDIFEMALKAVKQKQNNTIKSIFEC